VCKADNLPPSCAVFTKSGNLNFLEPSGPVQACNGTALPFLVVGIFYNLDVCTFSLMLTLFDILFYTVFVHRVVNTVRVSV